MIIQWIFFKQALSVDVDKTGTIVCSWQLFGQVTEILRWFSPFSTNLTCSVKNIEPENVFHCASDIESLHDRKLVQLFNVMQIKRKQSNGNCSSCPSSLSLLQQD